MTANFHKILKKLQNEGITIFLSSHDLAEVQAICDRVGIIKEGKMVLVEAVEDLKTKFLQNVQVMFEKTNMPTEDDFKQLDTVISVEKLANDTFKLQIGKNVGSVLKYVSQFGILRFTCEDASLEEIFLQYYE